MSETTEQADAFSFLQPAGFYQAACLSVLNLPACLPACPPASLPVACVFAGRGAWKTEQFKPYNFNALGQPTEGGHLHPLLKVGGWEGGWVAAAGHGWVVGGRIH